jgi:pectate lyase
MKNKDMKKSVVTIMTVLMTMAAWAQDYDLGKPFGFCTATSRTDAGTYDVTGGGCYTYPVPDSFKGRVKVLTSNGQDMKSTIQNAIKNNDVVILDGNNGEFIVSSNIGISGIDKTIIGINNAIISTKWYVTDEIKEALNAAGVPSMSTSGGGGTLPNGQSVSEEAEYNTRKIIIELTNDNSENYRKSGCISLSNCQNIIIRNITFKGPGAIDVGGYDLISCTGSKHCWVDHCEFIDGMDGNFDITQSADFNTVSWCIFRYTDRSYMHQNTNLIGSSDSEKTGFLNTTFAFNWWAPGCKQRMPMGRVGKIHMLNNYYNCSSASLCMNPRKNSEFLIEGNYFEVGVKNCYKSNDATAVTWAANNTIANTSVSKPSSFGSTVTVPYAYTVATTNDVPSVVQNQAGPTLTFGSTGISTPVVVRQDGNIYNLRGQRVTDDYKGIVIINGKKYSKK